VKIEGNYSIPASRGVVWRALLNPEVLQRSIPGCEKLVPAGDNRYTAVMKAGVGAIRGTFTSEFSISDVDPEKGYTLSTRAKSPVGFVEGSGRLLLEDAGPEQTSVKFSGDVKVGGMLASVAGRLMEAAAQKNIRDMFTNFTAEVAKRK
jgi:carbon monoxide dehydrogenase subunit G